MALSKADKAAYDREYRAKNKARVAATKKAYAEANREREAARVAAWVATNQERSREIKRAYKARNPDADKNYILANAEAAKTRRQKYYAANQETIRHKERERAQRPENKEKIAAYKVAYRARRPDVHRTTMKHRRRGVSHATPAWADKTAIKAIYVAARANGMHVDHIVPLKGKYVCGLHVENNLQPLPPKENLIKGNKHAG